MPSRGAAVLQETIAGPVRHGRLAIVSALKQKWLHCQIQA